jgi:two-component system sensor histidine kinase BaeS
MRRRILVAILGTVAAALTLTGAGTYLLLSRQVTGTTEANLRSEAEALVRLLASSRRADDTPAERKQVLRGLRLEGIGFQVTTPNGKTTGALPEGVTEADLDRAVLNQGATQSGHHGTLAWGAAGLPRPTGNILTVILTRQVEQASAPVGWYLLSAGIVLAGAAGVAWLLSGSLTRPLRRARAATASIAAGDLTTTLPEPAAAARDEVADLTRSINAMARALDRSRGAERQFLLSVSHDLRTPLTSIKGWAEAITDGAAHDPVVAARVISGEAGRLDRLVTDLLDLARIDSNGFALDRRILPVGEVATDTAEGLRPAAEAAGLALDVVDRSDGARAVIDPDRLAQCVANLVENGMRYAAGSLTVATSVTPAGTVRVDVVDDGPGIPADDLARVFDRHYVGDQRPSRVARTPSGLGLAIVHDLVAAMGGTVSATSPATRPTAPTGPAALPASVPAPLRTPVPAIDRAAAAEDGPSAVVAAARGPVGPGTRFSIDLPMAGPAPA